MWNLSKTSVYKTILIGDSQVSKGACLFGEAALKPALQLPAASIGWEMSKNDYSSIAICISAARLVSALTLQNQDFEEFYCHKSKKLFSGLYVIHTACVWEKSLFHKFGRCKSDFILSLDINIK